MVRIVVPFAAGGVRDIIARSINLAPGVPGRRPRGPPDRSCYMGPTS